MTFSICAASEAAATPALFTQDSTREVPADKARESDHNSDR